MLGLPYERPAALVRSYLEVLNAAFAGPGSGRRRERRLPRAQPARHHRHHPDADPPRRARAGDAARRGRARVRDDPLDGRRAGHRRARRPADHGSRVIGGSARAAHRRRASRSRCARNDEVDDARAPGRTRRSGTPSTRRTTCACSSTATRPTSATSSPRGTSRRSSIGSAASATRASPTSRSGCCRSGPIATRASSRSSGRSRSSRRCVPSSERRPGTAQAS